MKRAPAALSAMWAIVLRYMGPMMQPSKMLYDVHLPLYSTSALGAAQSPPLFEEDTASSVPLFCTPPSSAEPKLSVPFCSTFGTLNTSPTPSTTLP